MIGNHDDVEVFIGVDVARVSITPLSWTGPGKAAWPGTGS